jgi:hypothetical protein
MLELKTKGYRALTLGLIVTAFVTACVKNNSDEGGVRTVTPRISLQSFELTNEQTHGDFMGLLASEGPQPVLEIEKIFNFHLTDIRSFQVRAGAINNTGCSSSGTFSYSFHFTERDGGERILNQQSEPLILTPGSYKLRVVATNGAHCSNVSMEVIFRFQEQEHLTLTPVEDRSYRCTEFGHSATYNGSTSIEVQTQPLEIYRKESSHVGATQSYAILNQDHMCQRQLSDSSSCRDQMIPAHKNQNPIYSSRRVCLNGDRAGSISFSQIEIAHPDHNTQIHFLCSYGSALIEWELSDCELLFNLGKALPLVRTETEFTMGLHYWRVNYQLDSHEIPIDTLPDTLFYTIVARFENEALRVSPRFYRINKLDFLQGKLHTYDRGFRERLAPDTRLESLRIVFSQSPNLKQGLYHIDLEKLCDQEASFVIDRSPRHEDRNLCEEF